MEKQPHSELETCPSDREIWLYDVAATTPWGTVLLAETMENFLADPSSVRPRGRDASSR